ncbi:50S ribosomal protein L25 [Haloimpatiens sp. FM7330]|uniref:50S ribosomal protein L25 n=1 Tax=Haloimpatiens sp. FM7330 TaxID=3298610 RepID=UPI003644345F
MENLVINKRNFSKCNYVKRERKKGLIPGILYGKEIGNYLFEVGELELNKHINDVGEHGIIDLDLQGSNVKAIIKEVQREPVRHKVIHIDLQEIDKGRTVQTEVPINFNGERLISKKGGILQKERNSLKVQCNAENLPKSIDIDLSSLEIGDVMRVSDVEFSDEIILADALDTVIVSVTEGNTQKFDEDNEDEKNVVEEQG